MRPMAGMPHAHNPSHPLNRVIFPSIALILCLCRRNTVSSVPPNHHPPSTFYGRHSDNCNACVIVWVCLPRRCMPLLFKVWKMLLEGQLKHDSLPNQATKLKHIVDPNEGIGVDVNDINLDKTCRETHFCLFLILFLFLCFCSVHVCELQFFVFFSFFFLLRRTKPYAPHTQYRTIARTK